MNRIILLWVLCLLIVGCASSENRAKLAEYEYDCAHGDQASCSLVPYQRSLNQDEAVKNGFVGAALLVLLPILILGEVAQAREEQGICGWGKNTHPC